MSKRPPDQDENLALVADKRARLEDELENDGDIALPAKRHSMKGPTMLLAGHDGEIFTCKFHPTGTVIASAGGDRSIYLWSTRGDCENYAIFKAAHANAILDLQYSLDGNKLMSCSADKTVVMWDSATGCRLKKLRNHNSFVNSLAVGRQDTNLLASVSDDRHVNIWDLRKRKSIMSIRDNYQLTAVSFNMYDNAVFVGGIESSINMWDLRKVEKQCILAGHTNTITGLSLSPDGQYLLSNSMDNTLKCWNVSSSYNSTERLERTYLGHQHNFERNLLRCSWSPKGNLITAGSSDRLVYVWNSRSCDIIYKLPGHRGSVNEVVFSPREPLLLSCGSDKQLYLGELNTETT